MSYLLCYSLWNSTICPNLYHKEPTSTEFVKTTRNSSRFAMYSILTKNSFHSGSIALYLKFCLISVHFLIFIFQELFHSLQLCTTNTLYACFQYIVHQSTPVYINKGKSDHVKYLSCIQNRKTPKKTKKAHISKDITEEKLVTKMDILSVSRP